MSNDMTPESVFTTFKIASFLLRYPGEGDFVEELSEASAWLNERPGAPGASDLQDAIDGLRAIPADDLENVYVTTFDFHESTSLYLTAHELGDSRGRGPALLELRGIITGNGYMIPTNELSDYLPLLFEFMGVQALEGQEEQELSHRLARVCVRIARNLATDSPYRPVFQALSSVLPTVSDGDDQQLFPGRESADTGVMPYPLQYE